jgi:hypothetical protein
MPNKEITHMLRLLTIVILFCVFSTSIATTKPNHQIKHVIYITLDGTRWQDIYLDHSHLKTFWEKHANKVIFYGMPNTKTSISVASIPTSLPSYQSQMSGAIQPCYGNQCGRITVQTFPEALIEKMQLQKQDVAVFSSWYEIGYSAEHVYGTIYTNTGNFPVYDPNTQTADSVMYDLNMQQNNNHGRGESLRYDKYTFAQAIHYFEVYKPRFLWISLDESDEAAHTGNLQAYHEALNFYDYVLDEVFTKLKNMQIEDETMLIVTTDHGRGNGPLWTSHGPGMFASKQTWAFVMNGNLKPVSQSRDIIYYSTLSIRPTVEAALGISDG